MLTLTIHISDVVWISMHRHTHAHASTHVFGILNSRMPPSLGDQSNMMKYSIIEHLECSVCLSKSNYKSIARVIITHHVTLSQSRKEQTKSQNSIPSESALNYVVPSRMTFWNDGDEDCLFTVPPYPILSHSYLSLFLSFYRPLGGLYTHHQWNSRKRKRNYKDRER